MIYCIHREGDEEGERERGRGTRGGGGDGERGVGMEIGSVMNRRTYII